MRHFPVCLILPDQIWCISLINFHRQSRTKAFPSVRMKTIIYCSQITFQNLLNSIESTWEQSSNRRFKCMFIALLRTICFALKCILTKIFMPNRCISVYYGQQIFNIPISFYVKKMRRFYCLLIISK